MPDARFSSLNKEIFRHEVKEYYSNQMYTCDVKADRRHMSSNALKI